MKRLRRRKARRRKIRRNSHLVYADPEWVRRLQKVFGWSDEHTDREVEKEARRRHVDLRRAASAPHKFTFVDKEYVYLRRRKLEALAQRELYNERNQYRQTQSRPSDGAGQDHGEPQQVVHEFPLQ
jgi:hypothetical protein